MRLVRLLQGPVAGPASRHEATLRALRCAIAIPVAFFVGDRLVGGAQVATFSVFGGFALLVFAEFPGERAARAFAYLVLGAVGAVFIPLGTLLSRPTWLAVVAMFVAGTGVLFVGVLSSALAGGGRAALLTFILPLAVRADADAIGGQLVGWLVALAVCVPAALFLFPPTDHAGLRRRTAQACTALAALLDALDARCAGALGPLDGDPGAEARRRLAEVRVQFDGAIDRPVGLTAGSRALARVVEELEWLTSLAVVAWQREETASEGADAEVVGAGARALRAGAAVLDATARARPAQAPRLELGRALDDLEAARGRAFDVLVADVTAGTAAVPALRPHELAAAITLVGRAVAWSAAADARTPMQRLLGRGLPPRDDARPQRDVPGLRESAASYARLDSVWFRNSVRGGLGLALAVLVADVLAVEHGFWVVLATLSALRSSAVATGATALQAAVGSTAGFVVGFGVIWVLGTGEAGLWVAFPVAVFLASFAPAVVSFAAGQAAFTVVCVVLFNLIEPSGWQVGLTRIEDVLLGSAVSLVVALLLWPRGAAAAVDRALVTAYRAGADYLAGAVASATGRGRLEAGVVAGVADAARALDDAMRQVHVEVGHGSRALDELEAAAAGATRLRLGGDALVSLGPGANGVGAALPGARRALDDHTDGVLRWARGWAPPPAADTWAGGEDAGADVARALRADGDGDGPAPTDASRRLLSASMVVDALERRCARLANTP